MKHIKISGIREVLNWDYFCDAIKVIFSSNALGASALLWLIYLTIITINS